MDKIVSGSGGAGDAVPPPRKRPTGESPPRLGAVAARAAAAARAWERAGIATRLRVLQDAGEQLKRQRPALEEALVSDGLSAVMASYWSEWVLRAGSGRLLELSARALVRWTKTPTGGEILVRRPDGVVLLVVPANSPTIQGAALFSILLPGNGVVVRTPPSDRGLKLLVERVLQPALDRGGIDPGLVALAPGPSREVLAALMPSPDVKTVIFFGNAQAGRAVEEEARRHGKKLVLELDGSDHMLVWKDATIGPAADSASRAWDASTTPCPVPKHLLVHDDAFAGFTAALLERVAPRSRTVESDPRGGRLVPVGRIEAYHAALEELRPLGEILCGGYAMAADGSRSPAGPYVAPTVVALEWERCRDLPLRAFDEEIFFPLLTVVRFRGSDEDILQAMAEMVEQSPFGLRASLWTASAEVIGYFTREITSTGMLLFNDDHAQVPFFASPWGGPKRSGGAGGESNLFWEKTSHLQAVVCNRLSREQILQVLEALGALPIVGAP